MSDTITIPQTWEELEAIKDYLKTADRDFLRFNEEADDYTIFRQVIPRELQIELILKQIGELDHAILVNRYPYSRLLSNLPYVKHWSLWSKTSVLSDEEIKKIVSEKFPHQRWIAVESEIKSMPEIWHTHVFVENR